MTDPVLADYISQLMRDEIAPLLPTGVAGMELAAYQESVLERLRNPAIGDQLSRLCRRGSTKMADYLLPSLLQASAEGRPRRLLTLAVAGWIRYARGADLAGGEIEVQDARADELRVLGEGFCDNPALLNEFGDLFRQLCDDEQFIAALRYWIESLDSAGLRPTLASAIAADLGQAPASEESHDD